LKADKIGYSDLFFVIICFEYLISPKVRRDLKVQKEW